MVIFGQLLVISGLLEICKLTHRDSIDELPRLRVSRTGSSKNHPCFNDGVSSESPR